MNNTVHIKQSNIPNVAIRNLFKHQYRLVNEKWMENNSKVNEKRFVDNEKFNLYVDHKLKINDKKSSMESVTDNWEKIFYDFKNDYEWNEFGHDILNISLIKNEILDKNPHINKNSNIEIYWKIMKAKSLPKSHPDFYKDKNKELRKIVLQNKDIIDFEWLRGKSRIDRRVNFINFVNQKSGMNKYQNKLITEYQIHFSTHWFEKMGWIKYKKELVLDRNRDEYVWRNIKIDKVLDQDSINNWFSKEIKFYQKELKEAFGKDNDKFLGAQLHMDESKPHINIQFHNLVIKVDNRDGKTKIMINHRRESYSRIYDYSQVNFNQWIFARDNFDKELLKPGSIKEIYNIEQYKDIDHYKEFNSFANNLSFLNEKEINNNIRNIDNEIINKNNHKEMIEELSNILKAIRESNTLKINEIKMKLVLKFNWSKEQVNEFVNNKQKEWREILDKNREK